jgi:hypothetical protein
LLRILERSSAALLVIGASAFLIAYIGIALVRLPYPFELEWMEGGSAVHVERILNHQPLYVRPSVEFTPFIYSPLYYYVSALPARVLGNGFVSLRLVSLLASLGSFVVIFLLVHRRSASAFASFLASCQFAATFRLTGAWFDLARVDSLSLFLLLVGVYLFDDRRPLVRTLGAATFLFLAFFTKQSALIVGISLASAALITRRGFERALLPGVLGILVVGSGLAMNVATDGWYGYYVFDVPARHPIETRMLIDFWRRDVAAHLAIASGFCVFALVAWRWIDREPGQPIRDSALFGSLLVTSYISRIHSGGYDNVLMPAAAGVAIYFGIGLAAARQASRHRPLLALAIILATGIQFLMLMYSPAQQLPSSAGREEGEKLLRRISAVNGDVYWAEHPWYSVVLGKSPQAQAMAISDVVRAGGAQSVRESLEDEMTVAVEQERYAAFVVDFDSFVLRPPNFERHYQLVDAHLVDDAFHPVTGWIRAPRLLFVRRSRLN